TVPASAPPKSVLKVVVTDQAGNEEVSYQQVNPGTQVELPITWYGDNGQLTVYLNGQAEPPVVLTPSGSSSAAPSSSGTSPSPSAGTGNSGGNG
ncbi:MAG: serine/threonine-protein kinase, partial [Sulfobacillus sp.]|nr:serine/threonine-protein kinase [Sulfobacillus sp.]